MAVRLIEEAGFEAWIVGGCLRDWFLERKSQDVDIATSALPWEIEAVFSEYRRVKTGISHGTVTVWVEGLPLEITTYRVDGAYENHRRPQKVTFTARLEEDLSRRDFTVNAMAWHPRRGLQDPFGGQRDLRRGLLRCVGEASRRFEEDALRILRALRFCAVYGFALEEETKRAMQSQKGYLSFLSAERSFSELKKTLASFGAARVMESHGKLWQCALPQFPRMTPQRIGWLKALGECKKARGDDEAFMAFGVSKEEFPLLSLALLLEGDLEKTRRLARQAKMSRAEEAVLTEAACLWSQGLPQTEGEWKRWIYREGYQAAFRTLLLWEARFYGEGQKEKAREYDSVRTKLRKWETDGECVSLSQLAIDGNTLLKCGIPEGREIKKGLERALFGVMEGEVKNEKESLLSYLRL